MVVSSFECYTDLLTLQTKPWEIVATRKTVSRQVLQISMLDNLTSSLPFLAMVPQRGNQGVVAFEYNSGDPTWFSEHTLWFCFCSEDIPHLIHWNASLSYPSLSHWRRPTICPCYFQDCKNTRGGGGEGGECEAPKFYSNYFSSYLNSRECTFNFTPGLGVEL